MLLPTLEIIKKMGLNIRFKSITKDCSIFGQIYFSDSKLKCYDVYGIKDEILNVKRGTILIDPNVYFIRNIGSMNNTIIHECVHWYLHRKFFELDKESSSISYYVKEDKISGKTQLDWMEWQASALAPRILMPAELTRIKIEELIKENQSLKCILDIYGNVIIKLAEFFGVSKMSAKLRMVDLGYKEAIGVFTYVDNHYISSYGFDKSVLENNETFTIGIKDAVYEYITNKDFRDLIDSGKYIYVESHYCINDEKYVCKNEFGRLCLTDYAKNNIDECCLIFDIGVSKCVREYPRGHVLYNKSVSDRIIKTEFSNSEKIKLIEDRALKLREMRKEAGKLTTILRNSAATFSDTLVSHMERLGFTVEYLEEKTLINAKTIQRMRTDDTYRPKLTSVIAICIGFNLNPMLSYDLIKKSGHCFMKNIEHTMYKMLLNVHYENSIYECNQILECNNFNPLSKEA